MTTVAVLADPPWPGLVLPELVEETPLSATEAADLYAAALRDLSLAVDSSGGELLVNYRPTEHLPDDVEPRDGSGGEGDAADPAERAVRDVVAPAVEDARYERQVGSTDAARIGNTVTHLLEREEVNTAAVLRPEAPLVQRTQVDSAAMKLRTSGVVLGPSTGGRVYYAGFDDPIDFEDAFATPALETLVTRAGDAGLDVNFLPTVPTIDDPANLATTVAAIRARRAAARWVPEHTAETIHDLGLSVADVDGTPTVVR